MVVQAAVRLAKGEIPGVCPAARWSADDRSGAPGLTPEKPTPKVMARASRDLRQGTAKPQTRTLS